MKNLKESFQGIVESPILIISVPPWRNFCWRSRGSSAASSVSPTFSRSTQRPKRTAFSSVRRKFFSVSFVVSMPFSARWGSLPMFLMKRFAWPWGSMSSGKRLARDMMMPFSTLDASCGRPQMVQVRMATASARVWRMSQPSVWGSWSSRSVSCQSRVSSLRKSGVKGPL